MGAAGAMVAITAASAAMQAEAQYSASEEQKDQLAIQRRQAEMKALDQSNKETDQVRSILSSQRAKEAAAGVSPSSQSFFAIQRDTFNKYAQDQKVRDVNQTLTEQEISRKMNQIDTQEFFGLAGLGLSTAGSISQQQRLNQLMGKE